MKILNLYSGLGGNRKLWKGVSVTAVENNEQIAAIYKKHFPNDKLVIGDAHEYLVRNFRNYDFIWSSPPCQSHSKMMRATRHTINKYPDLKLYEEILLHKYFFKGNWVVENVAPYYEPLVKPTTKIGRHLFWSNYHIEAIDIPGIKGIFSATPQELKKQLGFNYKGNIYYKGNHDGGQVLRNCVHPKLGLHVLNQANQGKAKRKAFIQQNQIKARAIELKQKQYETSNNI